MADADTSPPPPAEAATEASLKEATNDQVATKDAVKDFTENKPFIEPQPIREDQVQNAVKFLSHPKVRSSPIVQRRSFLERKGLSREEINEAFRRVPDPPSSQQANDNLTVEGKVSAPTAQSQSRGFNQAIVPPGPQLQPWGPVHAQGGIQPATAQAKTPRQWSLIIFGLGLVAAAGAGTGVLIHRYFVPKLKTWIRSVILEEDRTLEKSKMVEGKIGSREMVKYAAIEEIVGAATAAANAAAAAAAEVANTNRELVSSRKEGWENLSSFLRSLETQTDELKNVLNSLTNASQNLPHQTFSTTNGHTEAKGPLNFSQGSALAFLPEQSREGIKPQETTRVQISNSIAKHQISNGHAGSSMYQSKVVTSNDLVKEEPWWRRKKVEVESLVSPEQPPANTVQITEEVVDMLPGVNGRAGVSQSVSIGTSGAQSYPSWVSLPEQGAAGTSQITEETDVIPDANARDISGFPQSGSIASSGTASRRSWVPPPAPPTVMPGAASAIRYQKFARPEDATSSVAAGKNQHSFEQQPAESSQSGSERALSPEKEVADHE